MSRMHMRQTKMATRRNRASHFLANRCMKKRAYPFAHLVKLATLNPKTQKPKTQNPKP